MKTLFLALVFSVVFACSYALAQDASGISGSKLPDTARYEMVQSPFDRPIIFRLDRYTGQIHRLTTCQKDDSTLTDKCWKEMTVVSLSKGAASSPHFQIAFITAPKEKLTLLINLETGQTWQYGLDAVNDKWFPFMECDDRTINCRWRP